MNTKKAFIDLVVDQSANQQDSLPLFPKGFSLFCLSTFDIHITPKEQQPGHQKHHLPLP